MQPPRDISRQIGRIAGPLLLANLIVPVTGLVDTAMLGRLPDPVYLGAAGLGGSVVALMYWGLGFLRMSTTGLAAQAAGGGHRDALFTGLQRSLGLAGGLGLALWLAAPGLLRTAVPLLNAPDTVAALAVDYSRIRLFSAPATLINLVLIGWWIGQGDSRRPLRLVFLINALNIGLDPWLILGLDGRTAGAAWATVIADSLGCGAGLWLLSRQYPDWWRKRSAGGARWSALLTLNQSLFLRSVLLLGGFVFFAAQSARLGDARLAANMAMLQWLMLVAHVLDALAHAAESLTGRALGHGRARPFHRAVGACLVWAGLAALGMTALLWGLSEPAIRLSTNLPAVRTDMRTFWPWLLAMPLVGVLPYLLDGVFVGATRSGSMLIGMLLSVAGFWLTWQALAGWGNHGLWAAFAGFHLYRGLTLAVAYSWISRRRGWVQSTSRGS